MDATDQSKQVFVDDTGRRARFLGAAMRIASVLVAAYLCLLVAGFLGASWVPSVKLPVVGDIFDVGRDDALRPPAGAGGEGIDEGGEEPSDAPAVVAEESDPTRPPVRVPAATSEGRARADRRPPAPPRSRSRSGNAATPAPQSSPNRGSSGNSENAGPKEDGRPRPQPSPNRGSNGNSENAGPKPRPSDHPSNSAKGQAEPTPSPTP